MKTMLNGYATPDPFNKKVKNLRWLFCFNEWGTNIKKDRGNSI